MTVVLIAAPEVDDTLAELPGTYTTIPVGRFRLVIGPTGAFSIGVAPLGGHPPQPVADEAVRLAVAIRTLLLEQMDAVPFVEAVVVSPPDASLPVRAATVVPLDGLAAFLLDGAQVLASTTVARMAAVAEVAVAR